MQIAFDNSYARLGERFSTRQSLVPVAAPRLIAFNNDLARELGLDPEALVTPEGIDYLAGNHVPPGAEPIATAYAGHQFGGFVPQLGDGRAMLLGEVVDRHQVRRDIQLKGSGRTPFSRGGDGRAALGPVLREYIVSEAMVALDIPTTRALAAVATGEDVVRERVLPGAILTRVAASHIRVGTFQFFAVRGDLASLRRLADYVIARHYPTAADDANPYRALLEGVIAKQAALVARWMLVGFVHGVMNTDNTSVAGETIDYGPCAFMDVYDPATVFSSIDRHGRYAFAKQPAITHWNLVRFAECLLPLLDKEETEAVEQAQAALSTFSGLYDTALLNGGRAKLGLMTLQPDDLALWEGLLDCMAAAQADFTLTFRSLCSAAEGDETELRRHFAGLPAFDEWVQRWRRRLGSESGIGRATAMCRANPAFIPRNHRVEAMIEAAVEHHDFGPFEQLAAILSRPYKDQPDFEAFTRPPVAREPYRTFCGT